MNDITNSALFFFTKLQYKITQELEQYIRMSDRMPSEDTTTITVLYYPASQLIISLAQTVAVLKALVGKGGE